MEKLGIEKLKIAVVAGIRLGNSVANAYEDGKFTGIEAVGVAVKSFPDVVKVIKNGTQIKEEFSDLDQSEIEEIAEIVKSELNIQNADVDELIDKAIDSVVSLADLVKTIIEFNK